MSLIVSNIVIKRATVQLQCLEKGHFVRIKNKTIIYAAELYTQSYDIFEI